MSCYRPLEAYRSPAGAVWIGYNGTKDGYRMELPCGRCVGCRLDRARAWAVRIVHEAQLFDSNWFVTLTYDAKHLESLGLEYRDFQLFMKRLRKAYAGGVRFFCAGEYGGMTGRPHFHAILFNVCVADAVQLANGSYESRKLESVWGHGGVHMDVVNVKTAAYVAGYTQKKAYGRRGNAKYELVSLATGELSYRPREFVRMSLRPGIGARWYERFSADLFPGDVAVVDGARRKVPRYYWNKFRLEATAIEVEGVEEARFQKARERLSESTEERRGVREELALRREVAFSMRGL